MNFSSNINLFNTNNYNFENLNSESSQRESEKSVKESEGKSTSVMDYQNLNETFNTMPALQTSNEYFSDISSRTGAIRPKTVMDYDPERINNKKKSKDDKINNNEFQEIFDYNHQKSESMSTLQELNKKYNLGLKSFSGFMDSGLLRNSDDRDQVKVFESQNYENLKSYKIGGNLEYGNFLKKALRIKLMN